MLVELSIVPLDHGLHMKAEIARVIDLIDQSGINYQLTAMGTLLEGSPDQIWTMLRQCHETIAQTSSRVLTRIVIDDKRESQGQLKQKVKDVEEALGREVRT